jgi:hypothetical protein
MFKKLALLVTSTALAVGLGEGALRLFTPFPIHGRTANRLPHPDLGYVMDPEFRGIDEAGFRNRDGLGHVDLAAIGDSHTYGFNVRSDESWPGVLAESEGLTVYNYGVGGYGPLQYRWLFDDALKRTPRTVIVGFYVANDLHDYCETSRSPHWGSRLPSLGLPTCREGETAAAGSPGPQGRSWGRRGASLLQRTAIGSAFEQLVWEPMVRRSSENHIVARYDGYESLIGVARLDRHRAFTDPADQDTAQAYRASEQLLLEMAELAGLRGIGFSVLFIPSQENALFDRLDEAHPAYGLAQAAVSQERRIQRQLERSLADRGVRTASPLACLQEGNRGRLYPTIANGHPLEAGYACYARTASRLLH